MHVYVFGADIRLGMTEIDAEPAPCRWLLRCSSQHCSLANPRDVTVVLDPRGATALYDAIGQAVTGFGLVLEALPEHARPETVQVVVVTDGEENSSKEFGLDAVRALVTRQTEQFSWDFVFLGANQDAVFAGERLGFDAGSSMTFAPGVQGVTSMNLSVGRYVKDVRGKRKRGFDADERVGSMGGDSVPEVPGPPAT